MASKKKGRTSKQPAAGGKKAGKKTARKTTAARGVAAAKKSPRKKASRKKTLRRGTATARKTGKKAAAATKKSAGSGTRSGLTIDELSTGAQRLMLANLGLYGTVLDELKNQLSRARKTVQKARKDPDAANRELIARGEKLVDQIRQLMKESGAPATKQLNEQISDLRKALKKLRKKVAAG